MDEYYTKDDFVRMIQLRGCRTPETDIVLASIAGFDSDKTYTIGDVLCVAAKYCGRKELSAVRQLLFYTADEFDELREKEVVRAYEVQRSQIEYYNGGRLNAFV